MPLPPCLHVSGCDGMGAAKDCRWADNLTIIADLMDKCCFNSPLRCPTDVVAATRASRDPLRFEPEMGGSFGSMMARYQVPLQTLISNTLL